VIRDDCFMRPPSRTAIVRIVSTRFPDFIEHFRPACEDPDCQD